MVVFLGIAGLLMVPLGVYLYFLFRRLIGVFMQERNMRRQKIIAMIAASITAALSINVFGLWALIVFHIAAISAVIDILRLILKKSGCRFNRTWKFLYRSGLPAFMVTAVIMGYAYWNIHHVIETDYTVYTDKEIRTQGYRIVFLSDLHFETTMDQAKLQTYCAQIQQQNPDLVILGGDIVDEATSLKGIKEAFGALGQIKSTYGTYYVYGNHDKGLYSRTCDFTQEQLAQAVKDAGVYILEDETICCNEELSISGRKDRSYALAESTAQKARKSAQELLAPIPEDGFHLLIDHQPREMEENAAAGYDLMLSGHTHAGQMWPVGLLTTLLDKSTVNYGQKAFGQMELIVSSGIAGWGYPLRTGKHSEFVVIQVLNR